MQRTRFYLLLALFFTAPMSYFPSVALPLFHFSSFRIGLSQLLAVAFIATALPLLIKNARALLKNKILLIASIALIIDLIIGIFTTNSLERTILYSASLIFLLLLGLAGFLVWKDASKAEIQKIQGALLWSGIAFGALALIQLVVASFDRTALGTLCVGCSDAVFGFPRINVFAAEPQFFANSLLPVFFVAFFFRDNKRLATAALVLSAGAIGLTFSRGALLALAAGVFVIFVVKAIQKEVLLPVIKLSLVAISSIIVAFGLLILSASLRYHDTPDIAYNTTVSMIDQLSLGKIHIPQKTAVATPTTPTTTTTTFAPKGFVAASSNDRLSAASLAVGAWNDSFKTMLFGVGMGNLGPYLNQHSPIVPTDLTVYIWYILVLSELGLVGLAILVLPLAYALWRNYQKLPGTLAYFALATTVAFATQLFTFGSYINIMYLPLYLSWFLVTPHLVTVLRRKDT